MTDWESLIHQMAHDANSFVRKGLVNAQLLERDLAASGTREAQKYLQAVIASQYDLRDFLSRIVALADTRRRSKSAEDVIPLSAAVLGAKLECREALERTTAAFVVLPLPECRVSPRVQTVLRELIENSTRFADPERPLRIDIEGELAEDGEHLCLRVMDTGSGIAPEFATKLFQPLQRLDPRRSGFGLGLAICSGIVNDLGGTIQYEPCQTGALFVISVPAGQRLNDELAASQSQTRTA